MPRGGVLSATSNHLRYHGLSVTRALAISPRLIASQADESEGVCVRTRPGVGSHITAGKHRVVVGLLVAAAATIAASATAAQASDYQLFDRVASRGNPRTSFDNGYRGPQFQVTGWAHSSVDEYSCPAGQVVSNWLVVPDDASSNNWAFSSGSDLTVFGRHQFSINVTNWSMAHTLNLRLAASCTDDPNTYPYPGSTHPGGKYYGDYQVYWDDQFKAGAPANPTPAAYGGLVQRAFCWIATPGCPGSLGLGGGSRGKRVALRDGTNEISLTFTQPVGARRPPAVRLSSPAGCRAQAMPLSVRDGAGQLTLELRCRGIRRGAAARVSVGTAVTRNFRLRRGTGTVRVSLAKPAGSVAPYAYVSYGRASTPCRRVNDRLWLRSRTFTLRITARCGRAAGNAVGHLDVGGLLAASR